MKLSCGVEIEVDMSVMNDMELVDALAEDENDPMVLSKICKLLFGEKRKEIYDAVRDEKGRVPIEKVGATIMEVFKAMGEKGKNS